jgi:membrane protease YdiL (CAAX protease family)
MHWDYALILLLLGIAVPWLGRRRVRQLLAAPSTTKADRLALYASTIAAQWLGVILILSRTKAHRTPPAALGLALPEPGLTILVALALAALVFMNQMASLSRIAKRPEEMRGLLPQLAVKIFPQGLQESFAFFVLVSTVSFCEEVIYRGFVQRVFEDWAGGVVLAGLLASAVMFSLAHLYQGRRGLTSTFIAGLIFSSVRIWTGSLIAPMVAHFVADMTVGILAPSRLRQVSNANITMYIV